MSSSTSDPQAPAMTPATQAPQAPASQPTATGSWNPFSNSLSSSLIIKLDRVNFLSWKCQVIPTVIGHDLDEILFTGVPPPTTLLNETILASIANYDTSFSVWCAFEQKFASQTKARRLQLKGQFSHGHKGNLPISEFIDKVQSIANSLVIAGSPIDDQDLILQVLNGLGPEFDSVVSGIISRSDTLSNEEVQALLLSHESRIEHHLAMNDITVKMQANMALGQGRSTGVRSFSNNNHPTAPIG
ncbi:uncharacterized protein LOC133036970 [Cannabis sativa]|uniref:uncharacterized protein LOC133036970 n=1 Tax=Cannabis sativa TaxID=3483 RepID=UPI0029CA5466|nr:uncharacterized protein LOC133036970 [Cannabis sativa]